MEDLQVQVRVRQRLVVVVLEGVVSGLEAGKTQNSVQLMTDCLEESCSPVQQE